MSQTIVAITLVVLVVLSVGSAYLYAVYFPSNTSGPLTVFTADLYTAESSYLYRGFSNATGLPYATPKSAGSFALATQIAQGVPVSVFVSVSKSALESTYLKARAPGWGIAFASDQMSIGYSNGSSPTQAMSSLLSDYSLASSSNSSSDWKAFFTDLTSGSVKVGISNPNTDPAGYRAWIVLEAAGQMYTGDQTYFVGRLLSSGANVTGTSAAALLAPLESGQIQVLFMYLSAAVSHGLAPIHLPSHVNLGDIRLASFYSNFYYRLSTGVQTGGPILLFITVPKDSTETSLALEFVVYVVGHSSSMSAFGLAVLSPTRLYNSTAVPYQIAQLLSSGATSRSGSI